MITKHVFLLALLLACFHIAEAQQAGKNPANRCPTSRHQRCARLDEPFIQRMRELGYVDGKNIVFECRYADGKLDRLPEIAAEVVRSDVALIVTASTPATQAARKASSTIPIVVMTAGDLVGSGLVASLAKPGGNVTGLTAMSPDLSVNKGDSPL